MAKWKNSPEMGEYLRKLQKLSDTREYIGEAVYEGAGIVADNMKAQIQALPVAQKYARNGETISTITSVQKKGLVDGFGISHMRDDSGFYNVKLGFSGYNKQKTTKYPQGVPNSVIARSVTSGTSFRRKNDFVGRAVRSTKAKAERAIEKKLDEAIRKIME